MTTLTTSPNHKRLARFCHRCENRFVPTGKFHKVCQKCSKKINKGKKRCKATTKRGSHCTNLASMGDYCMTHWTLGVKDDTN